ncbi:hypothetical protein SDC9_146747 [bioreactor metagenome]|uniref:Uncharacterized protein n=1 Tax=bioreactor metagenome TaxID=1076179 RepID=A0A645EDP9_9ZZZZ
MLFIKCGVGKTGDPVGILVGRLIINKARNGSALEQMLFDDFGDVSYRDLAIKCAVRIDDHDRSERAKAEASGSDDFYFISKPLCGEFFFHCFRYCGAV